MGLYEDVMEDLYIEERKRLMHKEANRGTTYYKVIATYLGDYNGEFSAKFASKESAEQACKDFMEEIKEVDDIGNHILYIEECKRTKYIGEA